MSERPIYKKCFSRDFSLPVIEIWARGESTDPRQWTDKQQPHLPYLIFEKTKETVHCHMDPRGVEWIKEEIWRILQTDQDFPKKAVAEFEKRVAPIRETWVEKKAVSLEALGDYIIRVRDAWAWFEPVWWLMEMLPESSEDFKLVQASRALNEEEGPGTDEVVLRSLHKELPELGEHVRHIGFAEIVSRGIPSKAELERRHNEGYFFAHGKLFVGKDKKHLEEHFDIVFETDEAPTEVKEIKGQPAFKGKVQGKVRRIMSRSQMDTMQAGEILVTSMTTPDFMPALKKAAGFVTDEGGITCHAAIVARELKKPCIIGTKVATQVLKTGDLVEVDAEKGIVKVIESMS